MAAKKQVLSVRLHRRFIEEVKCLVELMNVGMNGKKKTVTDFVVGAIINEIVEVRRRANPKEPRKYSCCECKRRISFSDIALDQIDLYGKKRHTCIYCVGLALP